MKQNNLFLGLVLGFVGMIMIFLPSACIKAVVILLGIEALANGVYQLLYTRKLYSDVTFQYSVLIRGMFSIVVGLLACFLPLRFAQIMWTVMLYVLAFYLLAGSALLFFSIGKLRDSSVERRQLVYGSCNFSSSCSDYHHYSNQNWNYAYKIRRNCNPWNWNCICYLLHAKPSRSSGTD